MGDALILRIDPRTVARHAGTNYPATGELRRRLGDCQRRFPLASPLFHVLRNTLYGVEPFCVSPEVFQRSQPIESEPRFVLMEDLIAHRGEPEGSIWYAGLAHDLETNGVARYKAQVFASEKEIRSFLRDYVLGMVESLERTGYDMSRRDHGTAFIDADGRINKSNAGNHRFAAARLLGIGPVPVEILGVHRAWYNTHVGKGGWDALRRVLSAVEAAHGSWRGSSWTLDH